MPSHRSLELLDRLAGEGNSAFTAATVRDALNLSPQAASNLLSRLGDSGLVDRIAPGRYALRQIGALGSSAVWDDLGSAVAALFLPAPHRIGFLTALDQHGLLVRPVRTIQVASPHRPRERAVTGRPLRVVREPADTVLIATEPFGPSRLASVERALLDAASRPQLSGGASRLAEALAAVDSVSGLAELAQQLDVVAGYRRLGSIASTLGLAVARDLEPLPWKSLVELDRRGRSEHGWVDTSWGVAWPYPASELEAIVTA